MFVSLDEWTGELAFGVPDWSRPYQVDVGYVEERVRSKKISVVDSAVAEEQRPRTTRRRTRTSD